MKSEFIGYRKFTDLESAQEICGKLSENEIPFTLDDNSHNYVKVIGYSQIDLGITLNIKSEDFAKADKILETYYSADIESVDENYYLFEFTDEELKNIVANPYEWGSFDFLLARKLLKEKGIEFSEEYIAKKKNDKLEELSKVHKVPVYKFVIGYILAILIPAAGLIFGLLVINNNHVLPNGKKVYAHTESDKLNGKIILAISIIWSAILIFRIFVF
jgi:hypothetical protein